MKVCAYLRARRRSHAAAYLQAPRVGRGLAAPRSARARQAFQRRSMGDAQAFHRRSTSVPQAFHRRICFAFCDQGNQAPIGACVHNSRTRICFCATLCYDVLANLLQVVRLASTGIRQWKAKMGKMVRPKTPKVSTGGKSPQHAAPPDPHISMLRHCQLGGPVSQTGNKNGKRNSRNIEIEGVRGMCPYCLGALFSGSRRCV